MMHFRLPIAAFLLLAIPAHAAPIPDQWNGSGPYATGQGNRTIKTLAVSADGMTVYAGTGSGTVFVYAYSDTTSPVLSGVAISGITQTTAMLAATSSETGTGYWIVVARNALAPTAAQVRAGGPYSGVAIVAHGTGAMSTGTPASFPLTGLTAGTAYDLYFTAEDAATNLVAPPTALQFATTALADTSPDPFSFVPQTGVAPAAVATSNTITVTGIDAPTPVSIAGGTYSIGGAPYVSTTGSVSNGQTVSVRLTASPANNTLTTATLSIGGVSGTFDVTTQTVGSDTTPDPFAFVPQIGVAPGSVATSNLITVAGIDAPSPISIVGGTYSIGGAPYVSTPGSVSNGQTVSVRLTASAANATLTTATLTIGGVSGAFEVTTANAAAVPTLGEWAMLLLTALLAQAGMVRVHRRDFGSTSSRAEPKR